MRQRYLKEHRPGLYSSLILSEKLYPHLLEIDLTARERMEAMLPRMMEAAGVTEELKARDPMRWVGLMNTLKAQVEETIFQEILFSQLKFLYPLKTLVFPAFSSPRFGPFPSFFPLREEMRETFFRPSLQPYPAALRKFAWPLWWRGRKCSSWYLHQNVPAAPAHPWVRLREREGWSYMYASTDGSENHP